jgi:RND family efflux transporter MFP subunit
MTRTSLSMALCGVSVMLSAATAACVRHDAHAADVSETETTVAATRIVRGDIRQVLKVAADFRPFQEIDVHAKVAGYLKTITVDVGDHVRSGQLLAVLEIPELQDELRQGEAGVKRAQEEVNRARADLERAESAHDVSHLASTRLANVIKARPNLVAQQDLDEASGRDRVAEAQVATSKAALASASEQLEMAKAGQNKSQTLVDYTRITAPFAGVITHRYADPGAMIQAGTSSQTQALPLVRLSQNDTLRLVIPVPESAVSRIHLGRPVDLDVQSLHKTFRGLVTRFSNRLDSETRTMRVEVDVRNPTLELVPGMYANASLVLDEAKDVAVAPTEAVERGQNVATVFVVNQENRVDRREVVLGLEAAERVEIKRGLVPGDLVVIGSRSQLKAGMTVVPKLVPAAVPADGDQ